MCKPHGQQADSECGFGVNHPSGRVIDPQAVDSKQSDAGGSHWIDMSKEVINDNWSGQSQEMEKVNTTHLPIVIPTFTGDSHKAGELAHRQEFCIQTADWEEIETGQTSHAFERPNFHLIDEVEERERKRDAWKKRFEAGEVDDECEPEPELEDRDTAGTGKLTREEREERLTDWIMHAEGHEIIDPRAKGFMLRQRWGSAMVREDGALTPSERYSSQSDSIFEKIQALGTMQQQEFKCPSDIDPEAVERKHREAFKKMHDFGCAARKMLCQEDTISNARSSTDTGANATGGPTSLNPEATEFVPTNRMPS